jgi:hypothetical protein
VAQLGTVTPANDLIDNEIMVRPERFELPASWFVARRSIQLSYGRKDHQTPRRGSPEHRMAQMYGLTLGRVRGANITTSNAYHHSIVELTRLGGHLMVRYGGVRDGEQNGTVYAGV